MIMSSKRDHLAHVSIRKSASNALIRFFPIAIGLIFTVQAAAVAGTFNPTKSIGDEAPKWENLEGVDGKKHSLADYADKEVMVLIFTCNTCPYAVDYQQRINDLAKKYSAPDSKVAVVAINSNKVKEDLLPAMKERAKEVGFVFPYLHDDTQQVARSYGAAWTPEFFVLSAERKIVYMGSFDDKPNAEDISKHYVADAIEATLANKPIETTETAAVGCAIRFERQRRSKKP